MPANNIDRAPNDKKEVLGNIEGELKLHSFKNVKWRSQVLN